MGFQWETSTAAIVTENNGPVKEHGERRQTLSTALSIDDLPTIPIIPKSQHRSQISLTRTPRPSTRDAGNMVAELLRVFEDPRDCVADEKPVDVDAEPSGGEIVQPIVVYRSPSCNVSRATIDLDRAQVGYIKATISYTVWCMNQIKNPVRNIDIKKCCHV